MLNFVFFLIDDMGWKDTSVYGSRFYETPNIDKLASQGIRFTNAYAACTVCSPTRASILTGKYPARLHITDWIPGHLRPEAKLKVPEIHNELPLEEVTIAEALKPAGYVSACIGKWHLGPSETFGPDKQGFDVVFAGGRKGSPPSYFWPYNIPEIKTGEEGEYLTDRVTDEAVDFLEKNHAKPFFLYLSHFAVHAPMQAKPEMISKYEARLNPDDPQNNPIYAAMVESVDQSVERVLAKLDELGVADNTVVIFMSDNGGFTRVTSNAPLRAGKGTPYEGGIREPLIIRWPGVIKPGSLCDVPVISNDFFPTILEMAGVQQEVPTGVDGVSLVPLLKGSGELEREALYWHYPHYHPAGGDPNGLPNGAIRKGDYKLIEFYEGDRLELYNLVDDIGETTNLAPEMPGMVRELLKSLHDWRQSVGAAMPTPNPNYRP